MSGRFIELRLVGSKHIKMFKLTNRGMHIKTTKYFTHIRLAKVCHYQILERLERNHFHTQLMEYTLRSNSAIMESWRSTYQNFPVRFVYVCLYMCLSEKKSCNVYSKIYVPTVCCNIVLQCSTGNKVVCSNSGILCILVC